MKNYKTLVIPTLALLTVATLFLFSATSNFAQKKDSKNKTEIQKDDELKAREAIAKNLVGGLLFEIVTLKTDGWKPVKGNSSQWSRGNYNSTFNLQLRKKNKEIVISFIEFTSKYYADEIFTVILSRGEQRDFNKFGDRGFKVFDDGRFSNMTFCKTIICATISGGDEKNAELFAGYAAEAIDKYLGSEK